MPRPRPHDDIARKLGRARSTVTEMLSLRNIPENVRKICVEKAIVSKSLLLQIVRQETAEKMTALIEKVASQGGPTRQQLRDAAAKAKPGRPKRYVYVYRPSTKAFNLKLSFTKSRASRDEIIDALEAILRDLRKGK